MKLAMQLMIGDDVFRAIGHVAAQWAYLETQLDFVIDLMAHQPAASSLELKSAQSFMRRIKNLRKAARVVLAEQPDILEELLSIATDAASLRGHRDDIIHGQWKLHRTRGKLTTGIRVFKQTPTFHVRELPFSAEKAEGIAAKISATNWKLVIWCQQHIHSSEPGR